MHGLLKLRDFFTAIVATVDGTSTLMGPIHPTGDQEVVPLKSQWKCTHPTWAAANTAANLLNEPVCADCRIRKSDVVQLEDPLTCTHLVWELWGNDLICRRCKTKKPIKVKVQEMSTEAPTHNSAEQYVAAGKCPSCGTGNEVSLYTAAQGGGLFCMKCCKDFNAKGVELEFPAGSNDRTAQAVKTTAPEFFIHRHGLYLCCVQFIKRYVTTPSLWRQKDKIVTGERIYCPQCRGSIVYDGTTFKWGIQ